MSKDTGTQATSVSPAERITVKKDPASREVPPDKDRGWRHVGNEHTEVIRSPSDPKVWMTVDAYDAFVANHAQSGGCFTSPSCARPIVNPEIGAIGYRKRSEGRAVRATRYRYESIAGSAEWRLYTEQMERSEAELLAADKKKYPERVTADTSQDAVDPSSPHPHRITQPQPRPVPMPHLGQEAVFVD